MFNGKIHYFYGHFFNSYLDITRGYLMYPDVFGCQKMCQTPLNPAKHFFGSQLMSFGVKPSHCMAWSWSPQESPKRGVEIFHKKSPLWTKWGWVKTYKFINSNGMNIHKSQLFYRVHQGYQGFWLIPKWQWNTHQQVINADLALGLLALTLEGVRLQAQLRNVQNFCCPQFLFGITQLRKAGSEYIYIYR